MVWESVAAQQAVVVTQWQDFLCWLAVFWVDGWVMEKKNARPVPRGISQNLTVFGLGWVVLQLLFKQEIAIVLLLHGLEGSMSKTGKGFAGGLILLGILQGAD